MLKMILNFGHWDFDIIWNLPATYNAFTGEAGGGAWDLEFS
jgi:hypothetical protein